jgi:hypothetical protein
MQSFIHPHTYAILTANGSGISHRECILKRVTVYELAQVYAAITAAHRVRDGLLRQALLADVIAVATLAYSHAMRYRYAMPYPRKYPVALRSITF